ncbi:hypothetical protein PtrSN002B_012187, partial [Pyrenophora tritici-repentis]
MTDVVANISLAPPEVQLQRDWEPGTEVTLKDWYEYQHQRGTGIDAVRTALAAWFEKQAQGTSFGSLCGSAEESTFIVEHVQVFQEHGVSIALLLGDDEPKGFLVKESGKVPLCEAGAD